MGTIDLPSSPARPRAGTGAPRGRTTRLGGPVAAKVLGEETDKVLGHLEATVCGGEGSLGRTARRDLRAGLYAYIERSYNELLQGLSHGDSARRGPGEIGGILVDSMDDLARFNAGEIEKSARTDRWDHLEAHANGMLMSRDGAAGLVPEGSAYAVLNCVFRDGALRPKTVTDVWLSLNVPEYDLIHPSLRHRAGALYLIGKVVCGHLSRGIDREAQVPVGETDGDPAELAGRILERCMGKAIPSPDPRDLARNIAAGAMSGGTRGRGFDGAFDLLVSALAGQGLGYQVIEKLAISHSDDGYDVAIREYEDEDPASLPDERFALRLRYFDQARLDRDRRAYDAALGDFEAALGHFRDLLEVIYQDSKSVFRVNDFDDLARKNGKRVRVAGERELPSGAFQGRAGLAHVRDRMGTVGQYLNPAELRVSQERLAFLENEYARLEGAINPYRIQPGILLDLEISSIKRKRTTLGAMSGALNVFLRGLPELFRQDGDETADA